MIYLLLLFSLISTLAHGEPLDIRSSSAYCKSVSVHAKNDDNQALHDVAHSLNSHYLQNMSDSVYQRLSAAKEVGLKMASYQMEFAKVAKFCEGVDPSGKSLRADVQQLASLPNEVEQDFAGFGLKADGEKYLRLLVVAALEARRVRAVLSALEQRRLHANKNPLLQEKLELISMAYVRRLLRIQQRYPVLLTSGTYRGGETLEVKIENAMIPSASGYPRAIYFSDPEIESKLSLTPAGTKSAELFSFSKFQDMSLLDGGETFYRDLYSAILSGRRPISATLVKRMRGALDLSVRESIVSTMLKCQNETPCTAFSIAPKLAAVQLEKTGSVERLGPLACACRIGEQHEWVNGNANLALGLVSATAVVAATAYPIDWVVYLAYALAAADSGAAAAGIDDAYLNVRKTNDVAVMRSGGAVEPIQELETQAEYATQRYNAAYNVLTGIIGLLPPARILGRGAESSVREMMPQLVTQAKIEFPKGATGMTAPELHTSHYEASFNPKENLAPSPMSLREKFPMLAANLDRAAEASSTVDLVTRNSFLMELRLAARKMAASGMASDFELLQTGRIRSDLLPAGPNFKEIPFGFP